MNPIVTLARRLLNPLGVDVVRYDPKLRRAAAPKDGVKESVPTRIVIGGGDYNYGPLWHNIEYVTQGYADKYRTLNSNIDIPHDLTSGRPFPIADASVRAAYSSHVFEHLKDPHVSFILRDTHRAMQPGGYLRISCPNIDLYLRAFLENDLHFFHYRDHPHYSAMGIQDSVVGLFLDVFATSLGERPRRYTYEEVRNSVERMGAEGAIEHYCRQTEYDYAKSHYHVNWFNPRKLARMLQEAGFSEIYESALGQSRCPDMRDLTLFDLGDPKISMFVEARK